MSELVRVGLVAPTSIDETLLEVASRMASAHIEGPSPAPWGSRASIVGEASDPTALRRELRALSRGTGTDVAVTVGPLARRPPKLLLMDVDSTLINEEVIDELAEVAGAGARVAAITEAAMRGELDFREALRERVEALAGIPTSVFADVARRLTLSPGAQTLVDAAHASGARVAVVSGGFTEVVEILASQVGLDWFTANRLEVSEGHLTGRTTGPIIDKHAKLAILGEFAERADCNPDEVLAVGDGANDLLMLAAAGLGVAFCAKPVAAEAAHAALTFRRLDAVAGLVHL
ncbi:MAG TPA: phosphoserine phosphatase SerB [Propionibacteriaceae bacterium]|nr:phosphoserine phosphatase SerB [Propionibacteriaceae bacterium]